MVCGFTLPSPRRAVLDKASGWVGGRVLGVGKPTWAHLAHLDALFKNEADVEENRGVELRNEPARDGGKGNSAMDAADSSSET